MKHIVTAVFISSLVTMPAFSQDLDRLEPQTPEPATISPDTNDTPSAATSGNDAADAQIGPNLRGIVFLSHPSEMRDDPMLNNENRLDASRVPFLEGREFADYMAMWWNTPLSERNVQDLLATVNLYYAEKDRPFVNVSVPSQDISSGILRVLVVEGRLSDIRVVGNQWFEEEQYSRALGLETGEVIEKSDLQMGLDWISRSNPFRAATVSAVPGDAFGTTGLELHVRERQPWRLYSGVTNNGSETTDRERLVFGGNWGRAFGRDHQLNAQLSANPDFHKSVGVSANYRIPLPAWRHLFQISAAWSRIHADVPEHFDSEGKSWQVLTSYEVPLSPLDNLKHGLRFGVDFKRSDNNLEFGGIPVTDNITDVVQFSLAWQGMLRDRFGYTSLNGRWVHSPGDLSGHNDDEAFQGSRWGAKADYNYGRIDLQRNTPLPSHFDWRVTASWQQSSDNLLGSEQLGLSGTASVRGYENDALYADEGLLVRNELLLPAFSLLDSGFHANGSPDRLRLHLFYDYGRGNSVERLTGEPSHLSIDSVGLGARYQLGRYLSAAFEYGWQQDEIPGEDRDHHAHLTLMLRY